MEEIGRDEVQRLVAEGAQLVEVLPRAEYEEEHGGPLYSIRPDQCCHDRKILPLRRALAGYQAWISAIRGDQIFGNLRREALALFHLAGVEVVIQTQQDGLALRNRIGKRDRRNQRIVLARILR